MPVVGSGNYLSRCMWRCTAKKTRPCNLLELGPSIDVILRTEQYQHSQLRNIFCLTLFFFFSETSSWLRHQTPPPPNLSNKLDPYHCLSASPSHSLLPVLPSFNHISTIRRPVESGHPDRISYSRLKSIWQARSGKTNYHGSKRRSKRGPKNGRQAVADLESSPNHHQTRRRWQVRDQHVLGWPC